MRLRTNVDEVFAKLDGFVDAVRSVAGPRAVNKLGAQAQTAGFRRISEVYGIGPRTTERYATVKVASVGAPIPEFVLTLKGNGFPLADLNPTQTRKGVSVRIKGRRYLFPHAFLARMPNGHLGVMARGAYGGKGIADATGESIGRFVLGRSRLPINELRTFGPASTLREASVIDAMQSRVAEQATKVFAQEVRFATQGSGSR
jgi:hypothetical protein